MQASINKIERSQTGYGEIVLTVSVRRMDTPTRPKEFDFVAEWIKIRRDDEALKEGTGRYEKAVSEWRSVEEIRVAHNNMLDSLHLGEITLNQTSFVPTEPRK